MTATDLTDEVRDFALDVLAEWMDGYTTPDEGPQLRYRPLSVAEDGRSINVLVETCDPFPSDPKRFRIFVEVEEL